MDNSVNIFQIHSNVKLPTAATVLPVNLLSPLGYYSLVVLYSAFILALPCIQSEPLEVQEFRNSISKSSNSNYLPSYSNKVVILANTSPEDK